MTWPEWIAIPLLALVLAAGIWRRRATARLFYAQEEVMREMVEVDVCDLEGSALDYAVARAVGHDVTFGQWGPIHYGAIVTQPVDIAPEQTVPFRPSTDWSQGGPLIEECITSAEKYSGEEPWYTWPMPVGIGSCCGRTLLIASMRAIVMSEIGDPVQVPKELMG